MSRQRRAVKLPTINPLKVQTSRPAMKNTSRSVNMKAPAVEMKVDVKECHEPL
jgi:hypothetical protein